MRGRCVFLIDQVLSAGNEIVEDVLLARQVAGLVPLLSIFAAAAEVGLHENPALVEPKAREQSSKTRFCADAIASIANEECGMRAVEFDSFEPDDIHGNARPVF